MLCCLSNNLQFSNLPVFQHFLSLIVQASSFPHLQVPTRVTLLAMKNSYYLKVILQLAIFPSDENRNWWQICLLESNFRLKNSPKLNMSLFHCVLHNTSENFEKFSGNHTRLKTQMKVYYIDSWRYCANVINFFNCLFYWLWTFGTCWIIKLQKFGTLYQLS